MGGARLRLRGEFELRCMNECAEWGSAMLRGKHVLLNFHARHGVLSRL